MVSLKIEDDALKTEGDYEFHVSNVHYNPDTNKSVMLISFYHSPEKPETVHNDQCIEVLAEKLKQDFISFNKNKFNSSANYQRGWDAARKNLQVSDAWGDTFTTSKNNEPSHEEMDEWIRGWKGYHVHNQLSKNT